MRVLRITVKRLLALLEKDRVEKTRLGRHRRLKCRAGVAIATPRLWGKAERHKHSVLLFQDV